MTVAVIALLMRFLLQPFRRRLAAFLPVLSSPSRCRRTPFVPAKCVTLCVIGLGSAGKAATRFRPSAAVASSDPSRRLHPCRVSASPPLGARSLPPGLPAPQIRSDLGDSFRRLPAGQPPGLLQEADRLFPFPRPH